MSDYFTKVAMKALNATPVLRPRLPSWFGPTGTEAFEPDALADPLRETQPAHLKTRAPAADLPADQELSSPLSNINKPKRTAAGTADAPPPEVEAYGDDGDLLTPGSPVSARPALETRTVASVSSSSPQPTLESSFATTASIQPPQQSGNDRVSSLRLVESRPVHVPRRAEAPTPSSAVMRAGVARAASRSSARAEPELASENPLQRSALPALFSADPFSAEADSSTSTSSTSIAGAQGVVDGEPVPGLPFHQARLPMSRTARPARAETVSPTVQVTIGRIEVRATPVSQPPRSERPKPQAPSRLEQYLKSRAGGKHE